MRRKFVFLMIVLLGLLLLGCEKEQSEIVATLDGEPLELSLIENYFDQRVVQFESADEELEAKRMALDSLIVFSILVRGAYDAGLEGDKEVNRVVAAERSKFLFDELYRQEVLPYTEVSDRDYDQFMEKMKIEYRFSHILVAAKELADSLYRELQQGGDFGILARTRSIDQASAVQGGDLGFLSWAARLEPTFRETAFALEIGEISEPIQTSFGWHIIKNEESRAATLPEDLSQLKIFVIDIMKQRRSADAEVRLWGMKK